MSEREGERSRAPLCGTRTNGNTLANYTRCCWNRATFAIWINVGSLPGQVFLFTTHLTMKGSSSWRALLLSEMGALPFALLAAASEELGGRKRLRGLLDEDTHSTPASEILMSALASLLLSSPLSLPLVFAPCFRFSTCSARIEE
jgi:hypothetical protein